MVVVRTRHGRGGVRRVVRGRGEGGKALTRRGKVLEGYHGWGSRGGLLLASDEEAVVRCRAEADDCTSGRGSGEERKTTNRTRRGRRRYKEIVGVAGKVIDGLVALPFSASSPEVAGVLTKVLDMETDGLKKNEGEGLILTSKDCTQLVKTVQSRGRADLALEVFDFLSSRGFETANRFTYTAAIGAAGATGELKRARDLFDEMRKLDITPDAVTFNSVMSACGRRGQWEEGLEYFELMQAEGVEPDTVTYNSLASACIRGGQLERALRVLEELRASPAREDAATICCFVKIYGRQERLDSIIELVDQVERAGTVKCDVGVYNAAIYELATRGRIDCAFGLLDRLQKSKLRAQTRTYNCLLTGLSRSRQHRKALQLLRDMKVAGCRPDQRSYTLVISACGRMGAWEEALSTFNDMQESGVVADQYTYSALITALSSGKLLEQAERIVDQMKEDGILPNAIVYGALIGTCESCGDTRRALDYFYAMLDEKVVPNARTFERVLALCERDNLWEDASRVIYALMSTSDKASFDMLRKSMRYSVPFVLGNLPRPLQTAAETIVESGRSTRDILEGTTSENENPLTTVARAAFLSGRRLRGLLLLDPSNPIALPPNQDVGSLPDIKEEDIEREEDQ